MSTTMQKSELNANRQWVRIFCFYQRYQFLSCNKKAGGNSLSPATVLLILQQSVPEFPAVLPRFQNISALSEVSTLQFFQSHSPECPCRCLFLTLSGFCAPFTFKRIQLNYEKHIFPRNYVLNFFKTLSTFFANLQISQLSQPKNTLEQQKRKTGVTAQTIRTPLLHQTAERSLTPI